MALATCSHVLPRRLVVTIRLVSGEDCVFTPPLSGGGANKLLEPRLAKVCPDHGVCSACGGLQLLHLRTSVISFMFFTFRLQLGAVLREAFAVRLLMCKRQPHCRRPDGAAEAHVL